MIWHNMSKVPWRSFGIIRSDRSNFNIKQKTSIDTCTGIYNTARTMQCSVLNSAVSSVKYHLLHVLPSGCANFSWANWTLILYIWISLSHGEKTFLIKLVPFVTSTYSLRVPVGPWNLKATTLILLAYTTVCSCHKVRPPFTPYE